MEKVKVHIQILPLCDHDSHIFKKFILLEDANADTLELLRLVLQHCPKLLGLIKEAFKPYKYIHFYDDYNYCSEMEKIHVLKILYRDNYYGTSKQRKRALFVWYREYIHLGRIMMSIYPFKENKLCRYMKTSSAFFANWGIGIVTHLKTHSPLRSTKSKRHKGIPSFNGSTLIFSYQKFNATMIQKSHLIASAHGNQKLIIDKIRFKGLRKSNL